MTFLPTDIPTTSFNEVEFDFTTIASSDSETTFVTEEPQNQNSTESIPETTTTSFHILDDETIQNQTTQASILTTGNYIYPIRKIFSNLILNSILQC